MDRMWFAGSAKRFSLAYQQWIKKKYPSSCNDRIHFRITLNIHQPNSKQKWSCIYRDWLYINKNILAKYLQYLPLCNFPWICAFSTLNGCQIFWNRLVDHKSYNKSLYANEHRDNDWCWSHDQRTHADTITLDNYLSVEISIPLLHAKNLL